MLDSPYLEVLEKLGSMTSVYFHLRKNLQCDTQQAYRELLQDVKHYAYNYADPFLNNGNQNCASFSDVEFRAMTSIFFDYINWSIDKDLT